MKTHPLRLILATSLFVLAAPALHAGVDSALTLTLTCYTQEKVTSSGDNDTGKVNAMRLNAKQLLSLLAEQINVNFPNGSQLRVADDGKVYVADSNGVRLRDVNAYFQANLNENARLFDGSRNRVTGQENTQSYFPVTFTINLAVLKGTVRGLLIEKFTVSSADRYGVQRINQDGSSTVNGSGTYNGGDAYFDGTLKIKGQTASLSSQ